MTIEKRFSKKFKPKKYKDWYLSWYYLFGFVAFLCLAYSVFASSKFYEVYLPSFLQPTPRLAISFVVSAFIALLVHFLTRHVLQKWHLENGLESIDFVFPVLVTLIAWNVYADYQGTPEVAESLYTAPVNSKASELHSKIESTQSRVDAIFWHYRWCPKHTTKHSNKDCKSLVVPTSVGSIKNAYSKSGYSPLKDRQDIERLNRLIDEYSATLSKVNADFDQKESKFLAKKERATASFQFGTLVASIIYIFISIWQYRFEWEVSRSERNKNGYTPPVRPVQDSERQELIEKIELMNDQMTHLKNSNQDTLLQREELLSELGRLEDEVERMGTHGNGSDASRKQDFNTEVLEVTPEPSEIKRAYTAGDTYVFETVEGEGYLITCKSCQAKARMQRKTAKFCSTKCRLEFHKSKKAIRQNLLE